jgi:CheY-like chemotaxis protein
MSDPAIRIAIINTSVEVIDFLRELFEGEGFDVVTAFAHDFKRGSHDFPTFCATHQPAVVVYDIAFPYEENWQFFITQILGANVLPASHFVLTTINKGVLDKLVGPTPTIELVGKPFDIDALVQAVQQRVHNG